MSIPTADDPILDRAMTLSGQTLQAKELRSALPPATRKRGMSQKARNSPVPRTQVAGAVFMNLQRLDWAIDAFRQAAAIYMCRTTSR